MTAPIPAGYLPRFRRQLASGRYAGANCGPVSTAHAMDWSTGGRVHPSPESVRDALGGKWSGPGDATSLEDQRRAWDTYRDDARRRGLRLGSYTRYLIKPWTEVTDALDAGYGVVLQVDHATINERRPAMSGDPAFQGLHVIFLARRRGADALDFDGLFDGRRQGIPKGPQWVPLWVLKRAAEDKVVRSLLADAAFRPGQSASDRRKAARERADGNAVFAIVTRSTPLPVDPPKPPDPKPDPGPDPSCEQRVEAAVKAVRDIHMQHEDAARDTIEDQAARINALEVALGTARTALLAWSVAHDETTAALADIDALIESGPDDGSTPTDGVGVDAP